MKNLTRSEHRALTRKLKVTETPDEKMIKPKRVSDKQPIQKRAGS